MGSSSFWGEMPFLFFAGCFCEFVRGKEMRFIVRKKERMERGGESSLIPKGG